MSALGRMADPAGLPRDRGARPRAWTLPRIDAELDAVREALTYCRDDEYRSGLLDELDRLLDMRLQFRT